MNFLNLIQSQLSPQTIGQVSRALGETPEATSSALDTAFPALLGAVVGKATSTPNGANDLLGLLEEGQTQGGWADNLGVFTSKPAAGSSSGPSQASGFLLLNSLFGSRLGPVTDIVANRSGIRTVSASSLLSMAAPVLMGMIGKHVASEGLDARSLRQLLLSQASYLKDVLPAGLANTLGIGSLLSGTHDTQKVDVPASARFREATSARSGGILKWAWVPVVLVLAAWMMIRSNEKHAARVGMGGPEDSTAMSTGEAQAPDFSELRLVSGGTADHIAKAISAASWNRPIELKGFNFDSSGALGDSGRSQIQDIGRVLAQAPEVKVQIIGYGDNDQAGLNHARAIKEALSSAGVAEDRMMVHGETGTSLPTVRLLQ